MIEDGRYSNRENGAGNFEGHTPVGNEQAYMAGTNTAGQTNLDGLCANGKKVAIRTLHRHGIREVDEMDRDGASVFPHGDIDETRSMNFNDRCFRVRPKDCIAQQLEMVVA